jgi:DNA helicase-2/ATP-dependent DNA helicase PcrA
VNFVRLTGAAEDHSRVVEAARCRRRLEGEKVLVIGDSMSAASRHRIARSVPGIVSVEPVQLADLTRFAANLDLADSSALASVLEFVNSVASNVGSADMLARLESLCSGRARNPASAAEQAALVFCTNQTYSSLASLIVALTNQSGVRIFRPTVLRACLQALDQCQAPSDLSFAEAAVLAREQYRLVGRQLPVAAIGSTLLLKGLETDHVVVVNAGELDARNLYVAITRGSKSSTLCAREPMLRPHYG